ncbi:MAG: HD domain-containing protein, partial [Candidatus Shapirobacteria bacterium]|nr:HD domain-containing protein [Candidatus Shapirobacteria bacterium]
MIRKSKTITIEQLLDRVVNYHPRADQDLIKKAYNFALQHHKDQKRLSGDSVITHGLAVAGIVADWRLDSISIGAGLLHDVIEDTPAKIDTIKKQ